MANIVKDISKFVNDRREAKQARRPCTKRESKKEHKANLARLENRRQEELREIKNTFYDLRRTVVPVGFARLLFHPRILTSKLYSYDASINGTTFSSMGTWVIIYRRGRGLAVTFDPECREADGRDRWSSTRVSRFSFEKLCWVVSGGDHNLKVHWSRESVFEELRFSIAGILE